MQKGVLRSVRSTALRVHGGVAGRRDLGVRMRVQDRATAVACSWRRAQQSDIRVLVSLEGVCAAGCAVQEGGRAVGEASSGGHAATEEDRAVCVPCCRAARDSLARHDHRGCGYTLGVPPHSTAQAAACSL